MLAAVDATECEEGQLKSQIAVTFYFIFVFGFMLLK